MLEPLYNLPLRLQTLHSKELKQEIASWCPPQTEFIEANQLPKFFSSQTLERSNCLVGWSSTWTVWSVRGGDWLFICSWDWQDLLAAQGWHQAWVSNQRAQSESCPSHEVEREQWEILVAIGEGPKVFWPDELTWQLGKGCQSLWWPLADTLRTCTPVRGTPEGQSTWTSAHKEYKALCENCSCSGIYGRV